MDSHRSRGRGNVWQLASGTGDRDYSQIFIEHDLAAVGDDGRVTVDLSGVAIGDIMILRHGYQLRAVGVVAQLPGATEIPPIRGWNLSHVWRVRWIQLNGAEAAPFRYRRRFSRVNKDLPLAAERALDEGRSSLNSDLKDLEPLSDGASSALDASRVSENRVLRDFHPLAQSFQERMYCKTTGWRRPSEHEVVAHFVVPIFRALGWAPENIALEWKMPSTAERADVAVFGGPERDPESLRFLIEAKEPESGVGASAGSQASAYRELLRVPEIPETAIVLVTNGFRYHEVEPTGAPCLWPSLDLLEPTQKCVDSLKLWAKESGQQHASP